MKAWFLKFSLRDQIALLALAGVVALYVVFMLLLQPQQKARAEMRARNVATMEALGRVDRMTQELRALRENQGANSAASGRSLTASINASAERMNLSITRLQPNSRGAVQLRFDSVALDKLLRWIYGLESENGVRIEELSLSQTSTPGVVSASLRMAAPP